MTMTPRERVLSALKKESTDRPPVAMFTACATAGMMRAADTYFPEAHSDAGKMARLGSSQAVNFGLESVRAGFCLTPEAEALGCEVNIGTDKSGPMVKEHPFNFNPMKKEYDEPELLDIDKFLQSGRVKVTQDAMSIMKKEHGEDYVVIAGSTGPFTLTGHLVNTENLIFSVFMDPDVAKKWISAVNPYCKAYGQALLDAGADVLQMSEPSSSTDILSPNDFPIYSGAYMKDSLGALNGDNRILHICGDTTEIIPAMFESGASGISIEEKVEPHEAIKIVNGKGPVVGNVGCAFPLFSGTPEDVIKSTKACVEAGFDVVAAGCGVPVGVPDASIKAMVDTVKSYGK
jgi:[methyl-Co(III) methanol-specific corrinoid protein]:coenzyme M methyltransferase